MRKLVFAKKINGTNETGLIDIAKNPPELFCLCDKDKANEILNLYKAHVSGELAVDECKCIRFTGGGKWYANGCKIHPNG